MKNQINRRGFIKNNLAAALAVSAFPTIVPISVLGKEGQVAPSNRITMGCIGTGPQGRGVMGNFLAQPEARVVAICDLIPANWKQAQDQVNKAYQNQDCALHHQYEELLARPDIDAVLIATPDHWHVPVAVAAARAKKDMYLEKPMGLSVAEDQLLRREIEKNKRVFQFGTQQRSSGQFRQACELVRNGRIGELKQINVWCVGSRPGGPVKEMPVPEGVDYERWLGPAAKTPYTDGKCFDTEKSWKTWWYNYDYALGFVAGWGVHPLDIAYWGHPRMLRSKFKVEGQGIFPTEGACNTSVAWDVQFKFGDGVGMRYRATPNEYKETVAMNDFKEWKAKYGRMADHGTAFEGTKGWILVDRTAITTFPEKLVEEKLGARDVPLMQSSNHAKNLLDGIRTRGATICPIQDAVQADVLCHLSDIATRVKRPLTWDPAKEQFVGDADANGRLAMRSLREPWRLR